MSIAHRPGRIPFHWASTEALPEKPSPTLTRYPHIKRKPPFKGRLSFQQELTRRRSSHSAQLSVLARTAALLGAQCRGTAVTIRGTPTEECALGSHTVALHGVACRHTAIQMILDGLELSLVSVRVALSSGLHNPTPLLFDACTPGAYPPVSQVSPGNRTLLMNGYPCETLYCKPTQNRADRIPFHTKGSQFLREPDSLFYMS